MRPHFVKMLICLDVHMTCRTIERHAVRTKHLKGVCFIGGSTTSENAASNPTHYATHQDTKPNTKLQ